MTSASPSSLSPPSLRPIQSDPDGTQRVVFRQPYSSSTSPPPSLSTDITPLLIDTTPLSPRRVKKEDANWGRKNHIRQQDTSNIGQRIERKLWQYSAADNVVERWLLETISWVLSAICMAAIAGVLFIYHRDNIIPILPLGLTLDVYIYTLSKTASVSLLLPVFAALGQLEWSRYHKSSAKKVRDLEIFEDAPRGPWGFAGLLVRTKGRFLAALSIAMTLSVLALDPFFRHIVEFPKHWRLQEGNGFIPVALGVSHQLFFDDGTFPFPFGKGMRADIPLACPNSNCTWPEYETLGVCSNCMDATDLLEFRCVEATLDWVHIPNEDEEGIRTSPEGTSCGWYLEADDPVLMTGYNVDRDTARIGQILVERAQPLSDVFTQDPLFGFPSRLNNSRNPLVHAIFVTGGSLSDIQRNATPKAYECTISWCVKTISSTYSKEVYTENITKITVNDTFKPPLEYKAKIYNNNDNMGDTTRTYIMDNITVRGDSGFAFHVNNSTHSLTLSVFNDILPSKYTLINSADRLDATLRSKEYIRVGSSRKNVSYNPFLYDNITKHLDNLATAITNKMRSATTNTKMIKGIVYDKESFVDVQWQWLGFPLGLLGWIFIFLLSTIIRSSLKQEHVGVYKTSDIATLLYGLPYEIQKKITAEKEHGTLRAKAKEISVKWRSTVGWKFSGNTLSPASPKPRHLGDDIGKGNCANRDSRQDFQDGAPSVVSSRAASAFSVQPLAPSSSVADLVKSGGCEEHLASFQKGADFIPLYRKVIDGISNAFQTFRTEIESFMLPKLSHTNRKDVMKKEDDITSIQTKTTAIAGHMLRSFKGLLTTTGYLEPPLEPRMVRIRWKCRCGEKFTASAREYEAGGASELTAFVEALVGGPVTATPHSSTITNQKPIYPQPRLWLQRVSARLATTFKRLPRQSTLPQHNLNTTVTHSPQGIPIQPPKLLYLLACMRSARLGKSLHQDCIDTIDTDRKLFCFLRQLFKNYRGRFCTLFSLKKVKGIYFIKFNLFAGGSVEVRHHSYCCENICECIPPQSRVEPSDPAEYRCKPAGPLKCGPPILPDILEHFFAKPSCIPEENISILNRLPKRIGGELQGSVGELAEGWGIYYQEGWDGDIITMLVFVMFLMGSLLFGVLWSCLEMDTQGAFGVSAYIITAAGILISLVAVRAGKV